MADLLSNVQKSIYADVFNDIHDTFSRPITVWKTPLKTVISSDPDFNFLYGDQPDLDVEYTPVSGVFDCRIQWQDPKSTQYLTNAPDGVPANMCRIKAKQDLLDFLGDAIKIEIDGRTVESYGSSQPHGLFNNDFYNIFFQETN
jgi:hypothetical protein